MKTHIRSVININMVAIQLCALLGGTLLCNRSLCFEMTDDYVRFSAD